MDSTALDNLVEWIFNNKEIFNSNQYLEIMKQTSEAKEQEEQVQQLEASNQQAEETLKNTVAASSAPPPPTPVNTQVTNPQQYSTLFPGDSLGEAIAQRKVI